MIKGSIMTKKPPCLRKILNDNQAINILKLLYDTEYVFKSSHFVKLTDIKTKLSLFNKPFSAIDLLCESQLITSDRNDSDQVIITLTNKGKIFTESFDHVHKIFYDKLEKPKPFKVEYDLTDLEKKILVICWKIYRETGKSVQLLALTQDVYPSEFPEKKRSIVLRTCSKLEKINLIKRETFQSVNYFELTESGKRVIASQLMKII
ncbi:hypothetical protein HN587_05435 [Candidatus Woesearchaeota archaeon]|mgnify:CR=1 FL=1|jgi:predicted transcriptional regulator|nr:hypothetical protein [Candidatus Woesearchaeota archaeon]